MRRPPVLPVLVVHAGASQSHRHRVEVAPRARVELEIGLAWSGDGAAAGTYLVLVPAPPWAQLAEDGSGVPLSIAALRRPGLTTGARRAAVIAHALGTP